MSIKETTMLGSNERLCKTSLLQLYANDALLVGIAGLCKSGYLCHHTPFWDTYIQYVCATDGQVRH